MLQEYGNISVRKIQGDLDSDGFWQDNNAKTNTKEVWIYQELFLKRRGLKEALVSRATNRPEEENGCYLK